MIDNIATETFVPKYEKVKQVILEDIRRGRLKPGDKLPVREELVKKYGTTRTTIDKAISGLVSKNILTASRRHGTFVATKKMSRRIALISWEKSISRHINHFTDRYNFFSLFGTLMEGLKDNTFKIIEPEKMYEDPQVLDDYDYILWNALPLDTLNDIVEKLNCREKIILLNRYYEGFNFASTNHQESSRKLTEVFLKNLPDESVFYFLDIETNNDGMSYILNERKKGFLKACEKYRRFYRFLKVSISSYPNYLPDITSLQDMQLADAPACVISPTMFISGAIMRFIGENGLRLNKDIYYADFNNENSIINTGYPIPSVLEDFMSMGQAAMEIIESEGKKKECFVPGKIVNNLFESEAEYSMTLKELVII